MLKPPDWSKLGFGFDLKVAGHIEIRHHLSTGKWTTPTIVVDPNITISGLSPGLNYGQQCYEGLKAFRTPSSSSSSPNNTNNKNNAITIFRPTFHHARLARSAASVSLPCPPEALFLETLRLAVASNAAFVPPADNAQEAYLYIRPVLFGASARLTLGPPEEVILAVYVQPGRPYHGSAALDGLVLEGFDRAAPRGMGGYKVGGNYAPVWRHAAEAQRLGYGITLHVDCVTRELVEEFSTSGFLGHRVDLVDGEEKRHVLVVPQTESAIASATSDSIARIAEREGWVVERVAVPLAALAGLDEVVAVGTAAAAVPIRSITRLSTGEKYVFANSAREDGTIVGLAKLMTGIQRGVLEDTEGWCWEVKGYPQQRAAGGGSFIGSILNAVMGRL